MLQTEQDGKSDPAVQKSRLISCENHGQDENPIEKAIVLEMNVVDNQKTG